MNRRASTLATLVVLPMLAAVLGCRQGQYDKELRLYSGFGDEQVAGTMSAGGWYVVGARMPDAGFQELGIRFPADAGERLELRREGEAIYIAWARQKHAPHYDEPVARDRRRSSASVGVTIGGLLESMWDGLFDRDDDRDRGYGRRKNRQKSEEQDRGRRYTRSSEQKDERQRTRDE